MAFNKALIVKMEPELRHVLAHLYYAIECLAKDCPLGALDNLKSIEGLIMFDGDEPEDWERYYNEMVNRGLARAELKNFLKEKKKMACTEKTKKSARKTSKKCKGKCKGKTGSKKCKGKCKGK